MQNYIPAGAEDDEDFDSDFDGGYSDNARVPFVRKELTLDEKFVKSIEALDWDEAAELLQQGANVHCRNSFNFTPIMIACEKGSKMIVENLLKNGANANDEVERHSTLFCLCCSSNKDEDEVLDCLNLISGIVDVKKRDLYGSNALISAAEHNRPKLAKRLIELGIPVNDQDSKGYTPMTYAVRNGFVDVINILRDAGTDLYHTDHSGKTYFEHARDQGFTEIADMFDHEAAYEETISEIMSPYNEFISTCPDLNDRLYGFSQDVYKILLATDLNHLEPIFKRHNIQLGHFLTYDDQQWENIGVEMSYDRKRIVQNVHRYHSKPWSRNVIQSNSTTEFTAFVLMQRMSNIVKQLHILSITTLYLSKIHLEIDSLAQRSLRDLEIIKAIILKIKKKALEIEANHSVKSADFIGPKEPKKTSVKKLLTIPAIIITIAFMVSPKTCCAMWKTLSFKFSS